MAPTVIMIMPGYPGEMPLFTRGLSLQGARVLGVAEGSIDELPETARRHLSGYLQVPGLFSNNAAGIAKVAEWVKGETIDRVCCLWEPGVELAAHMREVLGVPGQSRDEAKGYRNKDVMKQRLSAAGVRVPHHASATDAKGIYEAAEKVGYPLIIKPVDGAGSQDTFRCDDIVDLDNAIKQMGHVAVVDVEEFIEADEYTFDTVVAGGEIKFFHIGFYRPRPLVARTVEWISPQTLTYKNVDDPKLAAGREMGAKVLQVLGYDHGFSHMEFYVKPDGETVFGEVAARPGGARMVDLMNFSSDIDLFTGWAEAELYGTFSPVVERKYNCANITKRAEGRGRINRIEGLDRVLERLGPSLCAMDLIEVGQERRNWKNTLLSDGYVTLRHPDWDETVALADFVGTELRMYAG
jgi:hypothetical protein